MLIDSPEVLTFLDGVLLSSLAFSSINLSDEGLYNFTFVVNQTNNYFSKEISVFVNITLFYDVIIDSIDPLLDRVYVDFDTIKNFSIHAFSQDASLVDIIWYLRNDTLLETQENEQYFLLNASDFNIGNYTLEVYINNSYETLNLTWNVTILPEYYLFFLKNISLPILNTINHSVINFSEFIKYRGDNFTILFNDSSVLFSQDSLLINFSKENSLGILSAFINVSMDTNSSLVYILSNDFDIVFSEVTLSNLFDDVMIYSTQEFNFYVRDYFLFGQNQPEWNISNDLLNFNYNESTQLFHLITPVAGEYNLNISAKLNNHIIYGNDFLFTVLDPFVLFSSSKTIPDVSYVVGSFARINLSQYFSFGGGMPEFTLTNPNILYSVVGEELLISQGVVGSYTTAISANLSGVTTLSNTFNLIVSSKPSNPSGGGLSDSGSSTISAGLSGGSFGGVLPSQPINISSKPREIILDLENCSFSKAISLNRTIIQSYLGIPYSAYELQKDSFSKKTILRYNVSLDWIYSNGLMPDRIGLFIYAGEWIELPGNILDSRLDYIYYESVLDEDTYPFLDYSQAEFIIVGTLSQPEFLFVSPLEMSENSSSFFNNFLNTKIFNISLFHLIILFIVFFFLFILLLELNIISLKKNV